MTTRRMMMRSLSVMTIVASTNVMAWVATTPSSSSRAALLSSPSAAFQSRTATTTTTSRILLSASTASDESSAVTQELLEDPKAAGLREDYEAVYVASEKKLRETIPESYQGKMLPLFAHFVVEYLKANQDAFDKYGKDKNSAAVAANRILTGMGYALTYGAGPNKYTFDVAHDALRGGDENPDFCQGIDFYQFGCDFFSTCMNLEESPFLGKENLDSAVQQLEAGENVILFANHQSEADPQVVSALFEKVGYGQVAADMVYVAGHKVTTDPMAVPFSMGRNLICIHSKKHIDADPTTKGAKQKQNLRAMNRLLEALKRGGTIVWIAPSGGRDRRNTETGQVPLAPFDPKTLDMFRLMGRKSKVPTHFYTLAMTTYYLCPPPDTVEADVGEARNVRFIPVGVAMSEELTPDDDVLAVCQAGYEKLLETIPPSEFEALQ